MNVEEVMRVLGEVRNLDARIGIRSLEEARAKADAWHTFLRSIDVEDAIHAVRTYYRIHQDDVIQVGDVQAGAVKIHRDGTLGAGPRAALGKACPWTRTCACTHTGCTGGWLDDLEAAVTVGGGNSTGAAIRCPNCEAGRDLAAELDHPKRRP